MVILQYKNNYQYWKKSFIYLEFRLSPLYIFIKTILLESPGNFPLQRTACSCVCRAIRMYFMSPLRVFIFEIATGHFRSQVFIEKRAGYFFQSVDLVSTLHLTKKIFFCFPSPKLKSCWRYYLTINSSIPNTDLNLSRNWPLPNTIFNTCTAGLAKSQRY